MRVYNSPEVKEEESLLDSFDNYLWMELLMNSGGNTSELARVAKRLCDDYGNPIGTAHENLIIETGVYELEYTNGYTVPVSANIYFNLFYQVNNEGH